MAIAGCVSTWMGVIPHLNLVCQFNRKRPALTGLGKTTRAREWTTTQWEEFTNQIAFHSPVKVRVRLEDSEIHELLPLMPTAKKMKIAGQILCLASTLLKVRKLFRNFKTAEAFLAWCAQALTPGAVGMLIAEYVVFDLLMPWVIENFLSVEMTLEAEASHVQQISTYVVRASQEKVEAGATSSLPVLTRIYGLVRAKDPLTRLSYEKRLQFLAVAMAENRARVVLPNKRYALTLGNEGDKEAEVENDSPLYTGSEGFPVLLERESRGEEQPLRSTVTLVPREQEPSDEEEARVSCVLIAPPVLPITAGLSNSALNQKLAVSRHASLATQLKVSKKADWRLDVAADVMCMAFAKAYGQRDPCNPVEAIAPGKYPQALVDQLRETSQFVERARLEGFVKSAELMLEDHKLPRMVVSCGMDVALRNAVTLSGAEKLAAALMRLLMTKGLTLDEIDAKMAEYMIANFGKRFFSLDFSKMDSTWTKKDRARVRKVIEFLGQLAMAGYLDCHKRQMIDPTETSKLFIEMRHYLLIMEACDAYLFSGERMTSLGNRLLVIMLHCAEVLRLRGEYEMRCMLEAWLECEGTEDSEHASTYQMGDGDDAAGVVLPEYFSAAHMVQCYRAYGKIIEVEISTEVMELLSRHHVIHKGKVFHIPKIQKNLGRCVASPIKGRKNVTHTKLSPTEHSEIATAAYERAYAAADTLGLRWFAFKVGNFHHELARKGGVTMAMYSDDDRRKERISMSLVELQNKVEERINDGTLYMWPTANVLMGLWKGNKYTAATIQQTCKILREWDNRMREVDICLENFNSPTQFAEDTGLLAVPCLGISPRLLMCEEVGAGLGEGSGTAEAALPSAPRPSEASTDDKKDAKHPRIGGAVRRPKKPEIKLATHPKNASDDEENRRVAAKGKGKGKGKGNAKGKGKGKAGRVFAPRDDREGGGLW